MRVYLKDNCICYEQHIVAQLGAPFERVRDGASVFHAFRNKKKRAEVYPSIETMLDKQRKSFTLPINENRSLQVRFIRTYSRDGYTCQGVYRTNKDLDKSKRRLAISSIPANDSLWNSNMGVNSYVRQVFDYVKDHYTCTYADTWNPIRTGRVGGRQLNHTPKKISFILSDQGFIGQKFEIDSTPCKLHEIFDLNEMKLENTNFFHQFGYLNLDKYEGCEGIVASWINPAWAYWVSRELKRYGIYALPVVMFVI